MNWQPTPADMSENIRALQAEFASGDVLRAYGGTRARMNVQSRVVAATLTLIDVVATWRTINSREAGP